MGDDVGDVDSNALCGNTNNGVKEGNSMAPDKVTVICLQSPIGRYVSLKKTTSSYYDYKLMNFCEVYIWGYQYVGKSIVIVPYTLKCLNISNYFAKNRQPFYRFDPLIYYHFSKIDVALYTRYMHVVYL